MNQSRRNMRYQMARDRVSRNMRAIQGQSKREMFLRGIGGGFVFLAIGSVILVLNVQKIGGPSVVAALWHLPIWVWVVGGGTALFGFYWILRNIWLLVSLAKDRERITHPQNSLDK